MFRLLMLAVAAACVSLSAHAWNFYDDSGDLISARQRGDCLDEPRGFGVCISKEVRHVRTDTGTMPVRLWSRAQFGGEVLEPLLAPYGLTRDTWEDLAHRYGGFSKGNHFSFIANQLVLQGLKSADGKTTLLPAQYVQVVPLSDRMALVKGLDYRYYYVRLGEADPQLQEIPYPEFNFWVHFGHSADLPFTMVFSLPKEAGRAGQTLVVLGPEGEEAQRIPGVVNEGPSGQPHYAFGGGKIGFPVKSEDGAGLSVMVDSATLEMTDLGPAFESMSIGHALTLDWNDNNRKDYWLYAMQKVGSISSGHGVLSGGKIYQPFHGNNGTVQPFPQDGILGIVPLYLTEIEGIRGWLVVHESATGRTYRMIADAPDGSKYKGGMFELSPFSLMEYMDNPDTYVPLADIWIGTMDEDEYYGLFAGADRRDVPEPPLRVAARYFRDPANPAAGMTDWYDVGDDIGSEAMWKAYENRASRASHPDNPLALERPLILADARKRWESNKAYREYLETPWDVLQARYEAEARATLKASADAILAMNGTDVPYGGDFYTAARTLGGTYLQVYWRRWQRLPRSSDAYDICSRFGNNSYECNLVWPWAQNIFDDQRAQEQKAADAYARQVELTRRRPPAYNKPASERRCYDQGNGKELCFYD